MPLGQHTLHCPGHLLGHRLPYDALQILFGRLRSPQCPSRLEKSVPLRDVAVCLRSPQEPEPVAEKRPGPAASVGPPVRPQRRRSGVASEPVPFANHERKRKMECETSSHTKYPIPTKESHGIQNIRQNTHQSPYKT